MNLDRFHGQNPYLKRSKQSDKNWSSCVAIKDFLDIFAGMPSSHRLNYFQLVLGPISRAESISEET